ncbi:pyridoxal phosphate-dependent aminotransferase [Aggregatibacter actinomycetemcomitans]|uniref:pyridoxal phosphate-dependent aminotransferase n=1 Tax=Aggregatibacter actinomycetemcomitans TaxID=714 RepID=UPI00197B33A4|nr:histidinol-phosphate transaminase [Aggregatibacter actinomycetemcomitans]MBN6078924.1 histidinol-phosphate aminotransferase family protein [Aggregatibacter actinomycetemcomitans]
MQRRELLKLTGAAVIGITIAPTLMAKKKGAGNGSGMLHLNFNENSLGMSEKAKQAIINSIGIGSRYPDDQRSELIRQLAEKYNLEDNLVSLGNGSSENIRGIIQSQVFKARQAKQTVQLVVPDPTFNYAELYAQAMNVPVVKVPLTKDFQFDLAKLQETAEQFSGVSIFYLCNPNNPTSTVTPAKELFRWIKKAPENYFFLLDEAYAEYVQDPAFESGVKLIKQGFKNVAVTRTFSKFYAMAGYRVGYMLANSDVVEEVDKFMSIDNTNIAGAVAALASLKDKTFAQLSLQSNEASRKIVQNALQELDLKFAPSNGNFIFHEIKGDVQTYQERMKENGILVGREFLPIQSWSRLTLGTPEEMQRFVKVLKEFRQNGWV